MHVNIVDACDLVLFTCMHLADALIQSDLQKSVCVLIVFVQCSGSERIREAE